MIIQLKIILNESALLPCKLDESSSTTSNMQTRRNLVNDTANRRGPLIPLSWAGLSRSPKPNYPDHRINIHRPEQDPSITGDKQWTHARKPQLSTDSTSVKTLNKIDTPIAKPIVYCKPKTPNYTLHRSRSECPGPGPRIFLTTGQRPRPRTSARLYPACTPATHRIQTDR